MSPRRPRLDSLRSQWDSNPRFRLLVAGCAFVGWLIVMDSGLRFRDEIASDVAQASNLAERMRDVQGRGDWIERQRMAVEYLDALAAEVPTTNSPGVAIATTRSWVQEQVRRLGLDARISVSEPAPVPGLDGVISIQFDISGAFPPELFWELVRRIERSSNLTRIDTIELRLEPSPFGRVTFTAYHRVEESR